MIEGRPSRTAQMVAARRAVHQLLDKPLVLTDPLALRILGSEGEARVRAQAAKSDSRLARMLRSFLAVRSRVAEDLLAEAVAGGVTQYVVLGAGLDTFAYRNPHAGLRVFEVDFPATQEWKRQLLDRATIAIPPGVTFVPCDFATQTAVEALRTAGLDEREPVFFSWLGVTMYLTRRTVLATLQTLLPLARTPGGIVFDYFAPARTLPLMRRLVYSIVAPAFRWRVARGGEPFLSNFMPGDLEAAIRGMGATEATNHTPAALESRYLAGRRDGLRLGQLGNLMVARG